MNNNSKNIKILPQSFAKLKSQFLMWILLIPTVFVLIYCHWTPVFRGMYMSFFHTKGYSVTDFCGLENYKNVLTDTMFLQTLWNTVQYVVWSLVMGAIPPIILAIFMQEVIHGKGVIRFLSYLPSVTPGLAATVVFMSIFSPAPGGLLNYFLGNFGIEPQTWIQDAKMAIPLIVLTMSWSGIPGTVLYYLASLQSVNQDLYEAAMIDGATVWKRCLKITLPHLGPMTLLLWVRQTIGVFQIMQQPLVMTDGGPNNASLSLNLTAYKMAFQYGQVDRALALGTVSFVFLLVFSIFYFKMDKKLNN